MVSRLKCGDGLDTSVQESEKGEEGEPDDDQQQRPHNAPERDRASRSNRVFRIRRGWYRRVIVRGGGLRWSGLLHG